MEADVTEPGPEHAQDAEIPDPVAASVTSLELRIAAAMTGGVSLAIWMGGLTRELNLLQQASWQRTGSATSPDGAKGPLHAADRRVRDRYRRLLDLLDTVVEADVLAGTSAGGLNAAFFAFTRANGLDLGRLRDVWLEVGAFETLLRDPKEADPPSLLQGDKELLQGVRKALETLRGAPVDVAAPPAPTTDLFITTTLLTGETSRFTDTYGTQVSDVDHHGLFTFSAQQLVERGRDDALALAARCSASFPFAFEPSFVPFNAEPRPDRNGPHPAMDDYALTLTRDHWVADGGLLANRPIGPLLQKVFERTADRQIRRVLLYVIPTSGPPVQKDPEPVAFGTPPTLAGALGQDVGAVLNQSIAADLQAIVDHNDRVDSMWDTRLRMAELAVHLEDSWDGIVAADMFADFRARQSVGFVRPVIAELMRQIGTLTAEGTPAGWVEKLGPGGNAEEECRDAAAAAVAAGWPELPGAAAADLFETLGRYGVPAYDGATATVITMLRRAFVLAANEADRRALAGLVSTLHGSRPTVVASLPDIVKAGIDAARAGGTELVGSAAAIAAAYAEALGTPAPDGVAVPLAVDRPPDLATAWSGLAQVVAGIRRLYGTRVAGIATATGGRATKRESRAERQARTAPELSTYLDYFGAEPAKIGTRLLLLHVATRSVLPVGVDVEQRVELVQASADTRNELDPKRATAERKLTGLQLHHFGAFYKGSWRANDWMWGRLDGAGWLVHLVLDPNRVLTVAGDRGPEVGKRRDWFVRKLQGIAGAPPTDPDTIARELAFLDDGSALPASLPATAMWVARSLQEDIAAGELPVVAQQIIATPSRRTSKWAYEVLALAGREDAAAGAAKAAVESVMTGQWNKPRRQIQSLLPPDRAEAAAGVPQLAAKLVDCPVPDERLSDELAEPLFIRTATKAAAVGADIATGVRSAPPVVRPVLSTTRTVTLAGYRYTTATHGWYRWLLIGALALIAGGIGLALTNSSFLQGLGVVVALTGGYLLVVATFRFGKALLGPALAVTLIGLFGVLALPVVRNWLFGEGGNDLGVSGSDVVPWLRDNWYAILIVTGGLLVVVSFVLWLLGRIAARSRR
jgi:patatin-related protein